MPLLTVQTNLSSDSSVINDFISNASKVVAQQLGKPESYVMVSFIDNTPMLFAGNDSPCAYVELKSLGLPEDATTKISNVICSIINDSFSIDTSRIYIEFANPPRHMWGWDKGTF